MAEDIPHISDAQAATRDDVMIKDALQQVAEAQERAPKTPKEIAGYEIVGVLGRGGMGVVYEARQRNLDGVVALKVLRPEHMTPRRRRRFHDEARCLSRLRHRGIARIFEAGIAETDQGPQPFFAMELIHGGRIITATARDVRGNSRWSRGYRKELRRRLELMAKVCDAVQHAHELGIIHCDLKPGNILVDETGEPRIVDFGAAIVLTNDEQDRSEPGESTRTVGTPAYMSPEQREGRSNTSSTRTDVYSLGVVLHELLCGCLHSEIANIAVPADTQFMKGQGVSTKCESCKKLPSDVQAIIRKAFESEAKKRYGTAGDMGKDIRRYLEGLPVLAQPQSMGYQLRKLAVRHRTAAAAVFAALIALTWFAAQMRLERDRYQAKEVEVSAVYGFLSKNILENAEKGSPSAVMIEDLEADPARGLPGRTLMLLTDPISQAGTISAIHQNGRIEELDTQLSVPDVVTTLYSESNPGDVTGAILEDVLDGDGVRELVTLARHQHFAPCAIRIYDPYKELNSEPLAEWWNDGHLHNLFWNSQQELLVANGVSNGLTAQVPKLRDYRRIKASFRSNPDVIIALSPEQNAKGVLFPIVGNGAFESSDDASFIVRIPNAMLELTKGNQWEIHVGPVQPPDSRILHALCKVRVTYKKDGTSLFRAFSGHVDSNGHILDQFICTVSDNKKEIGRPLQSFELPQLDFVRLPLEELRRAQEHVASYKQERWSIESLREAVADLKRLDETDEHDYQAAIALAEWHLEDPYWLLDEATQVLLEGDLHQSWYVAGMEFAERALSLLPDEDCIQIIYAIGKYRLGEPERARELLSTFEASKGEEVIVLAFLAMSQYQAGRLDDARATRVKLLKLIERKANYESDPIARSVVQELEQLVRSRRDADSDFTP